MSPNATTSSAATPSRSATQARPAALVTPAADTSTMPLLDEWVASASSPGTALTASLNASRIRPPA